MFVPLKSGSEHSGGLATLSLSLPKEEDPNNQNNNEVLFLGRGGVTRITEPRMSRRIAKIQWTWVEEKPTLMIEGTGGQGTVQINAKLLKAEPVPLLHGDVVSLISPDMSNAYDYRVNMPARLLCDSQNTLHSLESSGSKRQSPSIDPSEEFACAICLEIMVEPVIAVPCGHAFCGSCLSADVSECPNCRASLIAKPAPSRPLCQAISLLVEYQPDLFSPDDVSHYRSRTASSDKPFKNQQQQNHHPKRRAKRSKLVQSQQNSVGMSAESAIVID